MSFEEEFDKVIRDKAEGADFHFDEKHWAGASRLIDERNAALRRGVLMNWLIPAAILMVLGVSSYFLLNRDEELQVTAIVSQQKANLADAKPEVHQPIVPALSSAPANERAIDDAQAVQPLNQTTNPPAQKTQLPTKQNEQQSVHDVLGQEMTNQQLEEPSHLNRNESTNLNTSFTGEPSHILSNLSNASGQVLSNMADQKHLSPSVSDSAAIMENNQEALKASFGQTAGSENRDIEAAATQDKTVETINLLSTKSLLPVVENTPEIQVFVSPISPINEDYVRNKKHSIGLELGGAYAQGWSAYDGVADGKGLNWFGGLYYGYQINPKNGLKIGIQYFNMGHIDKPYYMNQGKAYGFGYTSSWSSVSAINLHYVNVPVKYSYQFNDKYFGGLGMNASILAASQTRLERYQVSDGVKGTVYSETAYKVFEGSNRLTFAGSVFAGVKVNARLSISVEMFYGFNDLFANYGSIRNNESSTALRLGINYTIFNK